MKKNKYHLIKKAIMCILFFSLFMVSATPAITIIAHRGGTQVKPENTMGAFEHAALIGAEYFELDVRTTADDSIIVIHDGTVDRTTNGTGAVNSLTFEYIRSLDAGQGETIPTLSEALLFAKNKIKICLEIKAASVSAVLAKVRETNMQDEVILFDFSYANLTEAQGIDSGIPACYLVGNLNNQAIDDLVAINGEVMGAGGGVNSTTLAYAQDNNLKVWRYTVNDRATMESLIALGVDGIITDDPELLQEVAGVQDTTPPILGLVAHWTFSEGQGDLANDETEYANHLNFTGIDWVTGITSTALVFDGLSTKVDVPLTPSLNITTEHVSISAWLNLSQLPSEMAGSFGPVFDSQQDSYILYLDKGSDELRFKVTTSGGAERPGIPASELALNEWIHVAGVYNGTDARIYLNGELKDTHLLTGKVIGNQYASIGGSDSDFFKGSIDEVKIFNEALDFTEVVNLYNDKGVTNTHKIQFRDFNSDDLFLNPIFSDRRIYVPQLDNEKGTVYLYLHHLGGNILKTWSLNLKENKRSRDWDGMNRHGNRVAAGMYLLRYKNGRQTDSKIVILK